MLGIGFNADGTKMYRTGYSSTKAIFQYTLSTAWDISTASYNSVSFSLPSPIAVPYGIEWNGDGTKFVVCDSSTGDLYQFSLSTAYDISTTNSTPTTYDPSETTSPDAIKFNSDGTKAFVIGQGNDTIYRYSLSTAYDITTMSYDSNSFTYPSGYYGTGLELNSDGTEMYLQDHVGNSLRRYTLSTAYDLSTASLTSSFSTSSQFSSNTTSALCFSTDGTKLYISGYGASDFQYSTSGTASDKTLLTNVQVGSRFEETDTRKMYHNVVLTNGTTSENVGWYEEGTTTPQYPPTRGVFASGYTNTGSPSGALVIMDYVTIATIGNAINFGNLTLGRETPAGVSSYTRGVIGGGITSSASAEYITIATIGNATSFGNLTVARSGASSATNRSRGVWAGGTTGSNTDVIDYITIDTTGNATDFGNLVAVKRLSAGLNSATRGCFAGGYTSGATNTIDYITIASTGNATDFGDLSRSNYNMGAVSSDTRGVWAGGNGNTNVMDYITIASTGNATDFGDMNVGISGCGGNSDLTRGVFAGGWITNAMEYITIATTGNGTDFGDLTVARDAPAGGLVG